MIYTLCNLLIIFLFIYFIFYYFNKKYNIIEPMYFGNFHFQKYLKKYNLDVDPENRIISKCNIKKNGDEKCHYKKYYTSKFNTKDTYKLSQNKPDSNSIFNKYNLPVPIHHVINDFNKEYYLNEFVPTYPCVLKPVDGQQGIGVNSYIKTKTIFNKILLRLLKKYDNVMYENYIVGNVYRIFIFNNKVIDIVYREPPYVIGDGIHTVEELINEQNKISREIYIKDKDKCSTSTLNIGWSLIKEQGYEKYSILEKDRKILITTTINCHNGAKPIRVSLEKVPQINIDMFINAHKLIGLECSGIDYISDDITIPYNENNGSIIEINYSPGTRIHECSDNSNNVDLLYENMAKTFL